MPLELKLARRAKVDLDAIYVYGVQVFGAAVADAYAVAMMDVLDGLCEFPFTGSVIDGEHASFRRKASGAHMIFYRVTPNALQVARILHQRMDPSRHL
jgi:toxin ParE1/3/4